MLEMSKYAKIYNTWNLDEQNTGRDTETSKDPDFVNIFFHSSVWVRIYTWAGILIKDKKN